MSRRALVDTADGTVANVIEWEPDGGYVTPDGFELIDAEGTTAGPGDHWDGTTFTRPEPGPAP